MVCIDPCRAGCGPAGTSHSSLMPIAYSCGARPSSSAEPAHERLREIAAHAVGQDRHLRADVDARLEGGLLLAVLADAAIAGSHADDTIAVVEHFGRRETR